MTQYIHCITCHMNVHNESLLYIHAQGHIVLRPYVYTYMYMYSIHNPFLNLCDCMANATRCHVNNLPSHSRLYQKSLLWPQQREVRRRTEGGRYHSAGQSCAWIAAVQCLSQCSLEPSEAVSWPLSKGRHRCPQKREHHPNSHTYLVAMTRVCVCVCAKFVYILTLETSSLESGTWEK